MDDARTLLAPIRVALTALGQVSLTYLAIAICKTHQERVCGYYFELIFLVHFFGPKINAVTELKIRSLVPDIFFWFHNMRRKEQKACEGLVMQEATSAPEVQLSDRILPR